MIGRTTVRTSVRTAVRTATRAAAVAAALAAALWASAAPAQEDGVLEGVIERQIEAFRADDFAEAFTYASPMIRGMFGTPERFGSMVMNGYPMVWRPTDMRFLDRREEDGRTYQKLSVRGPSGRYHVLDYQMVETPDGWQINGVQVLPPVDVGA